MDFLLLVHRAGSEEHSDPVTVWVTLRHVASGRLRALVRFAPWLAFSTIGAVALMIAARRLRRARAYFGPQGIASLASGHIDDAGQIVPDAGGASVTAVPPAALPAGTQVMYRVDQAASASPFRDRAGAFASSVLIGTREELRLAHSAHLWRARCSTWPLRWPAWSRAT